MPPPSRGLASRKDGRAHPTDDHRISGVDQFGCIVGVDDGHGGLSLRKFLDAVAPPVLLAGELFQCMVLAHGRLHFGAVQPEGLRRRAEAVDAGKVEGQKIACCNGGRAAGHGGAVLGGGVRVAAAGEELRSVEILLVGGGHHQDFRGNARSRRGTAWRRGTGRCGTKRSAHWGQGEGHETRPFSLE